MKHNCASSEKKFPYIHLKMVSKCRFFNYLSNSILSELINYAPWTFQTIPYSNLLLPYSGSQANPVSFVHESKPTSFPLILNLEPVMSLHKCLWSNRIASMTGVYFDDQTLIFMTSGKIESNASIQFHLSRGPIDESFKFISRLQRLLSRRGQLHS